MPASNSKTDQPKAGVLYVVATPIGNLADMSERAVQILSSVDAVAAEDTRHSRVLFSHFGIKTRMISLNEQNEAGKIPALLSMLGRGEDIALISDAGTPLISDPGFQLVRAARETGLRVSPVPGASAMIAALSVAGLPTDRFVFEGFLPARPVARRKALTRLLTEPRTVVLYESVHRIIDSLNDMVRVLGEDRQAVVARELTKKFETVVHGRLGDLAQKLSQDRASLKGEFVVVIAGSAALEEDLADARKLLQALLEELPAAQAARVAAKMTGVSRKILYRMALAADR
ncbi:MAG: 16S rRNA (cytidine(1402)-2'-O)-methyltransferase [Gammaproteobacteria bacterium]|nr:MAG: 16S rRNA (cytidine(1402)-2'-O)-methyltransferase [Gammaproteobacteria bacterium]